MYALSIKIKNDELVLHGNNVQMPLRGCVRQSEQRLSDGHCLETLDLVIEGQPGQSRPVITRLQSFLERIRLGQPAMLELKPDSRSEAYQSRLYAGEFTWIVGSNQPKGVALRLKLERADFWELPLQAVPLRNRYGSAVVDGLRLDNRLDENGENQVFWAAEAIQGDLPTPLLVRLNHDVQPDLVIEQLNLGSARACTQDLPILEGEAATSPFSLSVMLDSSCNGGAYGQVTWNSDQDVALMSWVIPAAQWVQFAGRALRPLLRFLSGESYPADVWLRWEIRQGGTIYQSAACPLQPGRQLQFLPDLRMPSLPYGYETAADVQVVLYGRSSTPDAVMELDAIFLMGLDGWQQLQPVDGAQFVYGSAMVADSNLDYPLLVNLNNQTVQRTYRFNGRGLWSTPMEDQALQLVFEHEGQMALDGQLRVQIFYRPRVRVLL